MISMNLVNVEGGLNAVHVGHTEIHENEFVGADRRWVAAADVVFHEIKALLYHFHRIEPSYCYV